MKPPHILACVLLVAVAGCDNPKPRPDRGQSPAATAAVAPVGPAAPAPAAAQPGALSAALPKRPEFPGFYLDNIGSAADPMNRKPAVTAANAPILLNGFGFDPVAKTPAKGIDLLVDGKLYGTAYGHARSDVATFHKVPALVPVGFMVTLPPGTVAKGAHTVVVRVIAADGAAYFESPAIAFEAN